MPVLNDAVQRDAALAVFGDDAEQFLLRAVTLAALPEAPGPFRKHRRSAGQLAITGNDVVGFGPVNEVVIDRVGRFRSPGKCGLVRCSDVDVGHGRVVPENSITAAGQKHGHAHDAVLLLQMKFRAAIIHRRVGMLAQAVNGLVRREFKDLFASQGIDAADMGGRQRFPTVRFFDEHGFPGFVVKPDCSAGTVNANSDFISGQRNFVFCFRQLPTCTRRPADDGKALVLRQRIARRINDLDHARRKNTQFQSARLHFEGDAVGILLNRQNRDRRSV